MKIRTKILTILGTAAALCTMLMCGCTKTTTDENGREWTGDPDKRAILVVSFGTSYNETLDNTIGAIETKITDTFPDYTVKRAFTSQIIIDKIKERDGVEIENVEQALDSLIKDNYGKIIVQPTHVMNGAEYDEMMTYVRPRRAKTDITVGAPLLTSSDDYEKLVDALAANCPMISYNDTETAVVFMGHGTEHYANSAYAALDYRFKAKGYKNTLVGTVEGYPDLDRIKEELRELGAKNVVLLPLMIVAGDHANNDMAGDEEDSWKTQLKKEGYEVECILKGLGEYEAVQDMYVEHCRQAIEGDEEAEDE